MTNLRSLLHDTTTRVSMASTEGSSMETTFTALPFEEDTGRWLLSKDGYQSAQLSLSIIQRFAGALSVLGGLHIFWRAWNRRHCAFDRIMLGKSVIACVLHTLHALSTVLRVSKVFCFPSGKCRNSERIFENIHTILSDLSPNTSRFCLFRAFVSHNAVGYLPPVGDGRNSRRDSRHLRRPRDHNNVYRTGIPAPDLHRGSLLLRLFELLFVGRRHAREL